MPTFLFLAFDYQPMEMPDIGPGASRRCVGRTQSIEEAEMLVKKFEAEGFNAEIIRKSQAGMTLYEVWISRQPDVFSQKGPRPME